MTTNNHPANGPVSLKRLHQIREILSKASAQSDGGNLSYAMADAVKVIDEVLNAEPVAYMTYKGYLLHAADPKLAEYSDPTPLYDAPPAPTVPEELLSAMEEVLRISERDHDAWHKVRNGIESCRAAMINHQSSNEARLCKESGSEIKQPSSNSFTDEDLEMMAHGNNPQSNAYRELLAFRRNSPVTPDCWVMVPKKLTAENGAKAALLGEFNIEYTLTCHECFGEGCDDCSGEGAWINTIQVDWTTIKDIWAKGVEHFAAGGVKGRPQ